MTGYELLLGLVFLFGSAKYIAAYYHDLFHSVVFVTMELFLLGLFLAVYV